MWGGGGVSGPDEVVLCNARLSTTEWVRNRWLCSADVLHLTASSPAFKGVCSGVFMGRDSFVSKLFSMNKKQEVLPVMVVVL